MPDRFYRGMPATEAMGQLNGLNSDVQVAKDAAAASVTSAASSASQAAAARDAAIAAWSASTAPAEQLAAISKQIHTGAVVDVFLYDTSKDSDGGAWRMRCQHTSWESEPLCPGAWRGQLANLAAAWNVAGAAAGDFYQNTTDGKFYMLGGTKAAPTHVEVFRGNGRQFPALTAVMAEVGRVVIYDLTQPGAPMWMVFANGYSGATSIVAMNGCLWIGRTAGGVIESNFVSDFVALRMRSAGLTPYMDRLSNRNASWAVGSSLITLVNNSVNDIAATVLPGAPVDPATGLPVPTVAVATAGGVSVIQNSGVVVKSSDTSSVYKIAITKQNDLVWASVTGGQVRYARNISGLSAGFSYSVYTTASAPALLDWTTNIVPTYGSKIAGGASKGITLITENPATPTKGMVAYITSTSNTGYLVGDVRGAWLADTVAETITGGIVADRSVKNKPLNIVGSLTKAPVAAGAQLVAYSGFTASNYLEAPYDSGLDFGTGDFCVMGWINPVIGTNQAILSRGLATGTDETLLYLGSAGNLNFRVATTANQSISASTLVSGAWSFFMVARTGGVLSTYINGALDTTKANTETMTRTAAMDIGFSTVTSGIATNANTKLALLRISATVPSADQIAQIYRDELALFQPGAQCTIDGTSTAVTALAYDDSTDVLHVGTSWGRSEFKGLQRIASVATTSGAITAIAAGMGAHITGGTSSGRYVQPAVLLRDELRRREDARRAMAREEIPMDFDGVAAQTQFTLPMGFSVKGVFVAGTKRRPGPTKDYTVTFDGYRETVVFGVSPGATWVQITANRSI